MPKMACVYKITSPDNKVYVGQSSNYYRRYKEYFKFKSHNPQRLVYESFKKYKVYNHNFEILQQVDNSQIDYKELLSILEIYWINHYGSFNKGLNLTTGGKKGFKNSPESIRLISIKQKGIPKSEETKNKISIARIGYKYNKDLVIEKWGCKAVNVFSLNGNLLYIFPSIRHCERDMNGVGTKVNRSSIGRCCKRHKKNKQHAGFVFRFENDSFI